MTDVDLAWGVPSTLTVDDVDVHVEAAGPTAGVTCFLLHGFASGTFTWAGVAPYLASDLGLVAWDRPPFGRSSRPRPGTGASDPYGPAADMARTAAVLADPGGSSAARVLIAHSAGCGAAIRSVLDPDEGAPPVDGLVLLAPAIGLGPPDWVRLMRSIPGSDRLAVAALEGALRLAGPALRGSGRHRSALTDATSRASARSLRVPGTARALWHQARTWQDEALHDRLREITVPTLVIGGRDDRIATPAAVTTTAEHLGVEPVFLDDVGHAPQEQAPREVARLARAFLAEVLAH